MRLLATAIVSGSLGLIGVLPAAAGQPNSYDAPIQLAAGSDATADRDAYTQKAQGGMHDWQQKVYDYSGCSL